jgi:hypothetical protein
MRKGRKRAFDASFAVVAAADPTTTATYGSTKKPSM